MLRPFVPDVAGCRMLAIEIAFLEAGVRGQDYLLSR
jgi:hypothetical protein